MGANPRAANLSRTAEPLIVVAVPRVVRGPSWTARWSNHLLAPTPPSAAEFGGGLTSAAVGGRRVPAGPRCGHPARRRDLPTCSGRPDRPADRAAGVHRRFAAVRRPRPNGTILVGGPLPCRASVRRSWCRARWQCSTPGSPAPDQARAIGIWTAWTGNGIRGRADPGRPARRHVQLAVDLRGQPVYRWR